MSESGLRLVPLGTNGYMPTGGRHTMSFLVLGPDDALLLDAGTGVARLIEPRIRELLRPYRRLEVLLTHYHLDHVVGLVFLVAGWRDRPIRIWGPAPPLCDSGPREAIGKLLNPPLCGVPLDEFPMPIEIVELREERAEIAGFAVRLRRQDHPGGSIGVRLGDALAYVTDTAADPGTVELARGVDLLLHEVWKTDAERADGPGHAPVGRVAAIARQAGVRRLMPVHHFPGRSDDQLRAIVESLGRQSGIECALGEEGVPIGLDPAR
jgi:ribonuclease BN (tRNA processing enzyme)